MLHLGALRPIGPPAASSRAPEADGCLVCDPVTVLVIDGDDAPGASSSTIHAALPPHSSLVMEGDQGPDAGERRKKDARLRTDKPRTKKLTYYVCTRRGCGWSGSLLAQHKKSKLSCVSYPCRINYEKATGIKATVAAFLARCTDRQRDLGLAPDGARPVPMAAPDGSIDLNVLYLTVPKGCVEGDVFRVATNNNKFANVTVPDGRVVGDVISISSQ